MSGSCDSKDLMITSRVMLALMWGGSLSGESVKFYVRV